MASEWLKLRASRRESEVIAHTDEVERRREIAIEAIRLAHGTPGDEHGGTLFVSHHLAEIGDGFWLKHCDTARPNATQVLDILVLESHWGEEDDDGIDTFDFTLPDGVTNYVLSVEFSKNGNVSGISMQS